jgi:RNA polymerase-interacting CarD/CdnL/TRCF family regulator
VHPVHGAGVITGHRTFTVEGREHRYLCVDLKDANNSKVMIPEDSLKESGLREAIGNINLVHEIMFNEPRELDDHYRTRQANIRQRIEQGGIRQLIQGVRDLCWREYSDRLTNTDKRLREHLLKRLQREVIVAHEMSKTAAKQHINGIINAALETHAQKQGLALD